MSAPVERELKFAEVELEPLRERLLELEAERVAAANFEDNWIFDRDGGALQARGCVLRLRVDAKGATLTFKGPATFDGQTKLRIEHETRVADPQQMEALLEALGFEVATRYQKMREEWRLGSVVISLDHTPIGDFAEFEGEGGERVAKRCGFDPEKAERRSYIELYEAWRLDHTNAPPHMVFL
jgi:adenylate cyclase class 2